MWQVHRCETNNLEEICCIYIDRIQSVIDMLEKVTTAQSLQLLNKRSFWKLFISHSVYALIKSFHCIFRDSILSTSDAECTALYVKSLVQV